MNIEFTTQYNTILEKIDQIDPVKYGKTRNFLDGAVTYLSPYISRGVISSKQVLAHVLNKGYSIYEIEAFVKELCWRDYFQRVGQVKNLYDEIRQAQHVVLNTGIAISIVNANTGIFAIDDAIHLLYKTGYMHNHCRMYTASVVCNIAKSHWRLPAQWLYYHLLDGDWASNACSWQWVAGANSNKKYFANQENINKYTYTNQEFTFLDKSYEALTQIEVPNQLLTSEKILLETTLPKCELLRVDNMLPTFIYNYYNLDPMWHEGEKGNRILLLEPDFFTSYPVSKKCIEFILALSENIPQLQVFVGSFAMLAKQYHLQNFYYKEHPLNIGYIGLEEPRDWITDKVTGYYPSFFSYWKKVEKELLKETA